MTDLLQRILPNVQKPARYVGGEYNEIVKDKEQVDVRVAFCFPDTYEIGMSNLGMRILYGVINQMPRVWCERVFTPWGDMEAEMQKHHLPLWALESHDPVKDFDVVMFSVGYEMSYTNLLHMLKLAGIPIRSADRRSLKQLVIAGGTCMYNPEPLAEFIDLCSLGEGEDLTVELLELYETAKREGWSKQQYLEAACRLPGVYVPAFYQYAYNEDGTVQSITPSHGAPAKVVKRIVHDLDSAYFPSKAIVPSTEIVHDRSSIEIFRGCIRGCRFCQAGFIYRPVRPRSVDVLYRQAVESLEDSGYQELSLTSLSTSDYKRLPELAEKLLDYCNPRGINLSLPSLRADNFSRELMAKIQAVRKSGLTFAPEAGTQRLRDVINKNVTEEEILNTCTTAFSGGWNNVKLYFMLGLPTETDEDVLGIAELAHKILRCWKENASNKKRGVNITVSTAYFVPKPFTPFQWEAMIPPEEYMRRVALLRDAIKSRSISYHWHETEVSCLEAVLARGDRRLCALLERAVENGAKLDGWREYYSQEAWDKAFAETGIDPGFYAHRVRGEDELFPWEPIEVGLRTRFLLNERKKAELGLTTKNCRLQCTACGANMLYPEGECDA